MGGWIWVGGGWEVHPTYVHVCMHMHAHACMINMIISCKWPPLLWEYLGIPYDVICTCTCVCMHTCVCMCMSVGGTLSPPPTHIHPPPSPTPRGNPWNQSKFNSTYTNRDISMLFEDLKSVETFPPMGGCIVWWVGGFVDGFAQVKSLKIYKLLTESRLFNSV